MSSAVSILQPGDYPAWDHFVDHHPQGSFYHKSGWHEVITRAYGHPCYFLYVKSMGEIAGILPLVHNRSRLFGNALISTPFCIYGGVVANTPAIAEQLLAYARRLAKELKVDYLELRNRECQQGMPVKHSHVLFGTELADDDDAILLGIKKKQRAVVRQSLALGLSHQIETDISHFFRIYSESVRNLGTPVFPRRYFNILREVFAAESEILTVFDPQQRPVSSVLSFYYKDQVLPHYGGGTADARRLKSNDYMYYQLMCHARRQGCDYFDFGRSKVDTGAYRYKKHWGMTPVPLHYQYDLVASTELPSVNANDPKYALFINLWKRLPLTASQWIGPMLSRSLG